MGGFKAQWRAIINCSVPTLNGNTLLIHWRKHQEYLVIRLYQDLVGDWVVSECRGKYLSQQKESVSITVVTDYQCARERVKEINQEMRAQGYKTLFSSEQQLGLPFE
jgi:hypothetical protein